MSTLYNEYLTGADREAAIIVAESNAQFAKLNVLFEAVNGKLEADMLAAEAKVFTENGTYDDLTMLYTEAEAEANEKKEGLLKTIFNAIRSLFAKIKNFFAGKNTNDIPASIEMDADDAAKADAVMNNSNKIKSAINKFQSGDHKGALTDILAVALPTAAVAGTAAATGVVIWKADKIQQYLNGHSSLRNFLDTKIAGWQSKLNEKDGVLVDIFQKVLNKAQQIVNYIFGSEQTIWSAIENAKKKVKEKLTKGNKDANNTPEADPKADGAEQKDDNKEKQGSEEKPAEPEEKQYISKKASDMTLSKDEEKNAIAKARQEKGKRHLSHAEKAEALEKEKEEKLKSKNKRVSDAISRWDEDDEYANMGESVSIFGMEIDLDEETYTESAEDVELLNELSELFAEL